MGRCRSGAVQLIKSWLSLGQVRMTSDRISFSPLVSNHNKGKQLSSTSYLRMRTIRTTQLTSIPPRGYEKNTLFFTDFYSPCYLSNNMLIRFFSRSYSPQNIITIPRGQAGVCEVNGLTSLISSWYLQMYPIRAFFLL